MLPQWQNLLAFAAQVCALPTQGPGINWVGINGGYREDYMDKLGRVWHSSQDRWSPTAWGGWIGVQAPVSYTNEWGPGNGIRNKCYNWPPEYDQDYDALLQHYSREAGSDNPLTVRVNLQQKEDPVSYYKVKWNFCEKDLHGGALMDFWINGRLVKQSYQTKHHHTRTDIYHWKCIPTLNGKIELRIEGQNWTKAAWQGIQARFSTIEFEKTLDGCDLCEAISCDKGTCSASTFWDKPACCNGQTGLPNGFFKETPSTTRGLCHCAADVTGETCDIGSCAQLSCNEPFGGSCKQGEYSCINGYTGAQCATEPVVDQFGCYPRRDVDNGQLQVSTVCLPEKIAGPTEHNNFRGPSPMNTVADKTKKDVVYFSWTSDRPWGKASNAGHEGRIYLSKLLLPRGQLPAVSHNTAFDGFMRAGGIDMTEDGYVGTLCAKWFPAWYHNWKHFIKIFSPLVLAVCEVDASDMSVRSTPWRIGLQYQEQHPHGWKSIGIWGSYPMVHPKFGYGHLQYSPHHRTWSAWYGATVGVHTGNAMHTCSADAAKVSDDVYNQYEFPLPRDQVESRVESFGDFSRGGRLGTGDHQSGSAWRYHPKLKDIGLLKHNHGPVYMQQYGLEKPAGSFAPAGYSTGQVVMTQDGTVNALWEGSLRPCADGWIMGFLADDGNVCAKVDRTGSITMWRVIESSAAPPLPGGYNSMVRIAPLGSAEDAALCGSSARFLYGYEKRDRSRWLVELDGDCNVMPGTRQDVSAQTHWPQFQEWATTKDGAVVWVTTWHIDVGGQFGPKNSPNGQHTYGYQPQNKWWNKTSLRWVIVEDNQSYQFGLTPDATNEAKITVYYPGPTGTTSPAPPSRTVTGSTTSGSTTGSTTIIFTSTTGTTTPGPPSPWTTLYSTGSFGEVHNSKLEFNRIFQQARTGIARRECSLCAGSHKDVYFRRKNQPHQYDAWDELMVTWRGDLNLHSDFDLYSSLEDAFTDQNAWQWCNGNDQNIGFPRDCGPSFPVANQWNSLTRGGQSHYKWSVQLQASSTSTTTSSRPFVDTSIQYGDTVFLSTLSGIGNMLDIEDTAVQSRWVSRGTWQVITIESATSGGSVNSGDVVFLKTHTGAHIDVSDADEMVRARWNDQGDWQAIVIEKRTGSGPIDSQDIVCLRARYTGKHLDVEGSIVRARWTGCGNLQAMRVEKEVSHAIFSGSSVHLLAHTDRRLEVQGTAVSARWSEAGAWQTFVIYNYGGRAIFSGDVVFMQAHTGMMIDVQTDAVQARWNDRGTWQRLLIEKIVGTGAILPGDAIVLRAHTDKMLEVEGTTVKARFLDRGVWQTLTIEKSASGMFERRRLFEIARSKVAVTDIAGIFVCICAMVVITLASLVVITCRQWAQEVSYKVHPSQE